MSTHQQKRYENAYKATNSDYGMPDRKIVDYKEFQGKRILTIGGGDCSDVWFLSKDNEITALDYAVSGLEVAAQHGINGIQADLNQNPTLPFDDNTFDLVVCKDILEHILDPFEVMKEVRRILKTGGVSVVSVPNHFYLPLRLRILFGKGLVWKTLGADHGREYAEWNYMHIRFFTYRSFRRFLDNLNLQPIKWYWNFGDLAHYRNPDMWLDPQLRKLSLGQPISRRGKVGLYVIRPIWMVLNILFPRFFRSFIVSLSPGLLSSCFYVLCAKEELSEN